MDFMASISLPAAPATAGILDHGPGRARPPTAQTMAADAQGAGAPEARRYNLPPSGPLHHRHRRHFACQAGIGTAITLVVIGVVVWFVGKDGGIWRALFGR
jgi:hypothetical protein